MTEKNTPQLFVVGETIGYYHGEDLFQAKVTAVKGDEVTVEDYSGSKMAFVARESDGQHVRVGTSDNEETPDIIFHHLMVYPVKQVQPVKSAKSIKPAKASKVDIGRKVENFFDGFFDELFR